MSEFDEEYLDLTKTVLRQGELVLQDQLTRSLASDQRATTLAGMFTAVALAVLGFAAHAFEGGNLASPAGWAAIGAGLPLLGSVAFCVWCARPVPFASVGNEPECWWSDGVETRPLVESLRNECANYQKRITENSQDLKRAARALRFGLGFGAAAPLGAIAFWSWSVWVAA